MKPLRLKCVRCGREYPAVPDATVCSACYEGVDSPGILDVIYEPHSIKAVDYRELASRRERGIWRYRELLPIEDETCMVSLDEGFTPLVKARSLGGTVGISELYFKNETLNPTGSYKDRIAAMVMAKALEARASTVTLISSGNMAAGVAAYSAIAGLRTVVILPPGVPGEKTAQIALYGATIIEVTGTSTDRLTLCMEASREFGWYNANSPLNPYGPQGAKTAAYEEVDQFGGTFDWIAIPVGFGCNLAGHWKGYEELLQMNAISRMPRLIAVQPEGSKSFVEAFHQGRKECEPGEQKTIAGGISQKVTLNSVLGLRALRETSGTAVAVSDDELLEAERLLASNEGIFAEPSGAAALAGVRRLAGENKIGPEEKVLVLITGSGFKDIRSATGLVSHKFPRIHPSLDSLAEILKPL